MSQELPALPSHLYHYCLVGSHADELIRDCTLYFSSPAAFNDPFDGRIPLVLDGTDEEWNLFLQRTQEGADASTAEREEWIARARVQIESGEIDGELLVGSVADEIGVFCLSEKFDQIRMWSHYARKHRGFCLKFRVPCTANAAGPYHQDNLFLRAMRIMYSDELPIVRPFDTPQDRLQAMLLTKSLEWQYEREWRIIDHRLGPGEQEFNPHDLEAVIFGLRTTAEDIQHILDLFDTSAASPKFLRAQKRPGYFALDIVGLD